MSIGVSGGLIPKVLTHFCEHLVAFSWYEGLANTNQDFIKEPNFFAGSGFIVSMGDMYLLATAGHIFTDHGARMQQPGYMTKTTSLFDFWSPRATVMQPLPFDFFDASLPNYVCYEECSGLDFSLMVMPPLIGQALSQTIKPFRRKDWAESELVDYDFHAILGTPIDWATQERSDNGQYRHIETYLEPGLIFLKQLEWPNEYITQTDHPQFVGKIVDRTEVGTIQGMSGGPILGFKKEPDGHLRYFPVAIQSRWRKDKRIVVGTPLHLIGSHFEELCAMVPDDGE